MLTAQKVGWIFMTQLLTSQVIQVLYRQRVVQSQPLAILKFIHLQVMETLLLRKDQYPLIIMFLIWSSQVVAVVVLEDHLVVVMEPVVVAVVVLEKDKLRKHHLQEVH